MKKRKVKRYDEGGETEAVPMPDITEETESERSQRNLQDLKARTIGAGSPTVKRREVTEYIREGERTPMAEAESEKTFKQAFADARDKGRSNFTWRGKKYTTEMAAPTRRLGAKETSQESSEERKQILKGEEYSASKMGEGYKRAAEAGMKKPAPAEKRGFGPKLTFATPENLEKARKSYYSGFAKGGAVSASKRADGIAQRGKTRGRIC
jgi:hypothetical protein